MGRLIQLDQQALQRTILLLVTTMLAGLFLFAPSLQVWRSLRPTLFETLALALAALAVRRAVIPSSRDVIRSFFRDGPNLPVLLLVLYGILSWALSSSKEFSRAEWLRLACGAAVYYVVGTAFRRREQVRGIVQVLTALVIVTSLFGLVTYGQTGDSSLGASFGNAQLFAGFLLLVLPLMLVLSVGERGLNRKLVAQAAVVFAVPALLLAQTRSSWLALGVALTALAVMTLSQKGQAQRLVGNKHQLVVPAAILVGTLGLFLMITRTAPMIHARAATLTAAPRDPSFAWRLQVWKGAWKLIRERPIFGWGIGTFPLEQARTVPGAAPREFVQRTGPTLAEEAHNEYLQTAVEMGLLGLILHLWIVGSFLLQGIRALRWRKRGFRRLVLLGCLAGVMGQAVDAFSNPAWRFADVSFLYWVILGLGMAAAHHSRHQEADEASPAAGASRARPRLTWQGATLTLAILAVSGAWATRGFCPLPTYNGPIRLQVQPEVVVLGPGQCVRFRLLASTNNSPLVDVTNSPTTRFFTRPEDEECLAQSAAVTAGQRTSSTFCVTADACQPPGCGGRRVPVFATYGNADNTGQQDDRAVGLVTIACPKP